MATLSQLEGLDLSNNQITDISVITNLGQLNNLRLGSNQISDLTPLANIGYHSLLDLSGNELSDISVLLQLQVTIDNLYLSSNDQISCANLDSLEDKENIGFVSRGTCQP